MGAFLRILLLAIAVNAGMLATPLHGSNQDDLYLPRRQARTHHARQRARGLESR
jgi:hypothetical protein